MFRIAVVVGGEAVRIRARRDHGHDVGVVPGDLLGKVRDDAGRCDNLEALVPSFRDFRDFRDFSDFAAVIVPVRARRRDGERKREQQRGPERPQALDVPHESTPSA